MTTTDKLFASPRGHVVDFAFDESVAEVFPDMIRRSVPGYETVVSLLGVIAGRYVQENSCIYDLGCSLGAATLSMHNRLRGREVRYIAVDNSRAMIEGCQGNLQKHLPEESFRCTVQDIQQTDISDASVVVLNFTLQFVPRESRQQIIDRIFRGLRPGGVLVVSEKVLGEDDRQDKQLTDLYYAFKSANGYSDLEISQKRSALEQVMKLDAIASHKQRLQEAGFKQVDVWFQCFNFASMLAIKEYE